MKSLLKKFVVGMVALFPVSGWANPACPVCTIAIGAALPIARKLGVADSVVGLWGGALLTLMGYWLIKFFDKMNWNFRGRNPLLILLSVAMIGFVYVGQVKYNPIWVCGLIHIDPVLLGAIMGMILFVAVEKLYDWMKAKNGGHAHFPFEKVVLPIVVLILASWWLTACGF